MDNFNFDLETPIITFRDAKGNSHWTVRQSFEGFSIIAGTGAGKTSGSGAFIAKKLLSLGYGGLVLTTKSTEKDLWISYCDEANRANDLIIIEPDGNYTFDFLKYESTNRIDRKAITDNIADLLQTVINAGKEAGGGSKDDRFWDTALEMTIKAVIDLCLLAYNNVTVHDMYNIVLDAPKANITPKKTEEEKLNAFEIAFIKATENIDRKITEWEYSLNPIRLEFLLKCGGYEEEVFKAVPESRILKFVDKFFSETNKNISDKTRTIIDYIFVGFLSPLLRDPIYSLFCNGKINITPEASLKGKILLVNLPIKHFHKAGKDCQILFKYIWQRAMEKRDVEQNGLPVFLWADEGHNFIHARDTEFQATARSSRIATCYLTQNIHSYYSNMPGNNNESLVKGFLGTLGTKLFHANADPETNQYASELIGEAYTKDISGGHQIGNTVAANRNWSYRLERMVRPEEFNKLATGGPKNNFIVHGIIHTQGHVFPDGANHRKISFNQLYHL